MQQKTQQVLMGLLVIGFLSGCQDGSDASFEPEAGEVSFTDVSEEAGIAGFSHETGGYGMSLMPEIVGGGGGFLDYDGDGWQDMVLIAGGVWKHHEERRVQAIRLYRNEKNGTFREVTDEAGLADIESYAFGVSAADYDNDGDEDFFVSTLHENLLFRNDGGRFENVAGPAGLGNEKVWSSSSVFFDADRDGWLDLFVGNYVDWSLDKDQVCLFEGEKVFCTPQEYVGRASHFYRNNGDGTFVNASGKAGFWTDVDTTLDKTLGVAVFDFNKDGWPDITTGNDTENDMLFMNNGDGTFKEMGLVSGIAVSQHGNSRAGMGLDTGVVDSTGNVSIFVGNFSDETLSVFRYAGNGQFQDRAAISRLGFPSTRTLTFGLALLDADLDTDLDLLTANGHVLTHISRFTEGITFRQPPQLFLNRGNGIFDLFTTTEGPLNTPMVARGLAYNDYDRDGDVDVLFVENDGPARLWRNDTVGGGSLRIRTRGTRSNRNGLGAHLIVRVGDLKMERWIRTGASFLTSSEKMAFFGLGDHEKADSLIVKWPSGTTDIFTDIDRNQEILIEEGAAEWTVLSR